MSAPETTSAPALRTGRSPLARPTTVGASLLAATVALALTLSGGVSSAAGPATVGLGTAGSFVVLGGSTVTNTGPTLVSGDLGVSPGSAVTGFPPGIIVPPGAPHASDAVALEAQNDTTTAYNNAAGRPADVTRMRLLGGRTLPGGVYRASSTMELTGTLTLDGGNDPTSVFIFQAGSSLTTASAARVVLIRGASRCNVFWQVGSSATLGTGTSFVGNVLALTSITLNTGADVEGRLLARNGAVTLDTNDVSTPNCDPVPLGTATPDPGNNNPPDTGGGTPSVPAVTSPSAGAPATPGTTPPVATAPRTTAPRTTAPRAAPVRVTPTPVRATAPRTPVRAAPGAPAAGPRTPTAAPRLARPAAPVRAPARFTG